MYVMITCQYNIHWGKYCGVSCKGGKLDKSMLSSVFTNEHGFQATDLTNGMK